jgi:hydroxyacylglutathione hydrolase
MLAIQTFCFSPFAENTYVVHDQTKSCVIIDPGCYFAEEKATLKAYIDRYKLQPVLLLNTHCHLDHVFGNHFVHDTYQLLPVCSRLETTVLAAYMMTARNYGLDLAEESPKPERFVSPEDRITFGETTFEILHTPGHSPGSLCYFHRESKQLFSGDVVFEQGVGRTDLPGGSYEVLMHSIFQVIAPLGDDVVCYPGHGGPTKALAQFKDMIR